jgi:hypothetical protein
MKNLFYTLLIVSTFVLSSCSKQSFNFPFKITVVSEAGVPLKNITVEAGAPVPEAIPEFLGTTDENGVYESTYTYEAVLQIVATRGAPPSYIGCGFVKLIKDETAEITIVLQPYDPAQQGC